MRTTAALTGLAVLSIGLMGCAAGTPLERGTEECQEELPHAIEQASSRSGWKGAQFATEIISTEIDGGKPTADRGAFRIEGETTVTFTEGSRGVTATWTCFTQTVDGNTYASILDIQVSD